MRSLAAILCTATLSLAMSVSAHALDAGVYFRMGPDVGVAAFEAPDGNVNNEDQRISILVEDEAPVWRTGSLRALAVEILGAPGGFDLLIESSPPLPGSIGADATGLSGSYGTPTTFSIMYTASDPTDATDVDQAQIDLQLIGYPTIIGSPPPATINAPYSYTIETVNTVGDVSYASSPSTWPGGWIFDPTTGTISNASPTTGLDNFTITAVDEDGEYVHSAPISIQAVASGNTAEPDLRADIISLSHFVRSLFPGNAYDGERVDRDVTSDVIGQGFTRPALVAAGSSFTTPYGTANVEILGATLVDKAFLISATDVSLSTCTAIVQNSGGAVGISVSGSPAHLSAWNDIAAASSCGSSNDMRIYYPHSTATPPADFDPNSGAAIVDLVTKVRQTYPGNLRNGNLFQGNVSGDLIAAGYSPEGTLPRSNQTQYEGEWGGFIEAVTLGVSTGDKAFFIGLGNVPHDMCVAIGTNAASKGMVGFKTGYTLIRHADGWNQGVALTAAEASAACRSVDTVYMYYDYTGSTPATPWGSYVPGATPNLPEPEPEPVPVVYNLYQGLTAVVAKVRQDYPGNMFNGSRYQGAITPSMIAGGYIPSGWSDNGDGTYQTGSARASVNLLGTSTGNKAFFVGIQAAQALCAELLTNAASRGASGANANLVNTTHAAAWNQGANMTSGQAWTACNSTSNWVYMYFAF